MDKQRLFIYNSQIPGPSNDDELKRKRALANARLKKHRAKKLEETRLQNLVSPVLNKFERKRQLARERVRRHRNKKRFNDSQIPRTQEEIQQQEQKKLERKRQIAKECSRRYRYRSKTFHI